MKILNRRTDAIPEGAVNVARPSLLGNPFKIGKGSSKADRKRVIAQYSTYFYQRVKSDPTFRKQLEAIKDAPALVCYCKPLACHADVIVEYLDEQKR